jgi:hypothetical protein
MILTNAECTRATFAHSLAEMRGIFIGIMTNDDFNKLLGITESYKMPDRLMEILTGDSGYIVGRKWRIV